MASISTLFIVGAVVIPSTLGLFHRCPPNNGNFGDFYRNCACTKSQNTTVSVICKRISENEMLRERLRKLRDYTIDDFTLKESGPLALDSNFFRKLNIHKLLFEEVNFDSIPIFRAFTGLEFTLEELHFVRCTVQTWSWVHGRHFVHLKTVRFQDTPLPATLSDGLVFTHFPNKIRKLQINGCNVTTLGNQAFRRLAHLEHLELNRNGISSIQRSMFPPHVRRLKSITLSDNPLVSIADNTFVNMPRLEFLTLSNTSLASLRKETFFAVWDQLEEINFENIRLNCDCDSTWMFDVPNFTTFRAPYCNSQGKPLDRLNPFEKSQLRECPNTEKLKNTSDQLSILNNTGNRFWIVL